MLLIPFVENAFKHGTGHIEQPHIAVKLLVDSELLVFEVLNSFDAAHDISKDESSGIGLSNVKARLNMLYKDNYSLNINNGNNLFNISLTLKLA